jgi:hypothetical protein
MWRGSQTAATCILADEWYQQCLPAGQNFGTLNLWDQCGGKGGSCSQFTCADGLYPGQSCPPGATCQRLHEWYSQCRPGGSSYGTCEQVGPRQVVARALVLCGLRRTGARAIGDARCLPGELASTPPPPPGSLRRCRCGPSVAASPPRPAPTLPTRCGEEGGLLPLVRRAVAHWAASAFPALQDPPTPPHPTPLSTHACILRLVNAHP